MMDRRIRILGLGLLLLFLAALLSVNYIQVFAAGRIASNPANPRLVLQLYDTRRGAILAADEQTVLAESVPTGGLYRYRRVYPGGAVYAPVTGYASLIYGQAGLEASMNGYLSGNAPELATQSLVNELLGRPKSGGTVITTIVPRLQVAAARALGSLQGAVVAMDPRTGDVLAMVSNPSYDPAALATTDTAAETRAWKRLTTGKEQPLLSRANQLLYPPGSTFKLVTASAAFQDGMTPATRFPNPHVLQLPNTTHQLHNFGDEWCFNGAPTITLLQAFQISCNVVFGELGLKLGAARLAQQAEAFGFNGRIPFDVPAVAGRIPGPGYFATRLPLVAISAIGQDNVLANPLQMAMVASAIADRGVEMAPRLVSEVRDPSGRIVKTFPPRIFARPISSRTASDMTQLMISVVQGGTGVAAQIPGVQVAGKTGTAQNGTGKPHAWFVAFAPAAHPTIVVAAMVLYGGSMGSDATGGAISAPIAKAVIEAWLGK